MKAKILAFLGLLIATIGISLFASAPPAYARGERYEWINPTTIMASGGRYHDVNAADNGTINFPRRDNGTFEIFSEGACDIRMTITITSTDNARATLATDGCEDELEGNDFDRELTIANTQNGPVAIENADCNNADQNQGDRTRCVAIQACIATGQTAEDCMTAYNTCITNHKDDNGAISEGDKQFCIDNVTKGDLSAANATPPGDNKTACAIQGIGWLVCPVTNFLAKIVDGAYAFVDSLLTVQPLYTPGGNADAKGVYDAWSIMRNFANVAFVIAFLVVIFSQVTSIGITNYGIKRMLPRLIIAAILVNISYWVCAIAVDLSNIMGTSVTDLFNGLEAQIALPNISGSTTGGGWAGITLGIIGGTAAIAALYVGISALLPMLLAALVAIVTVFLVLTLRQALIILLIVISPLAFVAYLLPNTEDWFKKWRSLLQTLLLMFPIISIIFGASAIASKIVMGTATGQYAIAIQLMGAGISVIPLALTPIVMKTAGGVLNRFGGIVNNPNRGPIDRMNKGIQGYRKNRQEYRQLKAMNGYRTLPSKGITARRSASREAVLNNRRSELNRAKAGYVAGMAATNDNFRGNLAQGGGEGADERALAQAINVQANLKAEEVKAAHAIIQNANLGNDIEALQKLATGQSVQYTDASGQSRTLSAAQGSALQTAAIRNQFKNGDTEKTDELVMNSGSMGVDQRQAVAEGMQELSKKVRYYGGGASDAVAQGQVNSEGDLNSIVAKSVNDGKYSAEILANADKDALTRIADVAASDPSISASRKDDLKNAAEEIDRTPSIKNPDSRSQERLDAIKYGTRYTPPPPPPPPTP